MDNDSPAQTGEPLALQSNDLLGLVVDAAVIDCWKVNYGLEKTPTEIAAAWGNWAPTGAILALRAAVAEIERLRAELAAKDDRIAGIVRGNEAREAYLRSYMGSRA